MSFKGQHRETTKEPLLPQYDLELMETEDRSYVLQTFDFVAYTIGLIFRFQVFIVGYIFFFLEVDNVCVVNHSSY